MRLYALVPANSRIANKDTLLPTGGRSDQRSPVFVPAGTMVAYHVAALHLREDLWGKDATEFRPERWQNKLEKTCWVKPWKAFPGLPFVLLTMCFHQKFLPFNGGPRVCIGRTFLHSLNALLLNMQLANLDEKSVEQFATAETSYTVVRQFQAFKKIEYRDVEPWTKSLSFTSNSANSVKVALSSK